MEAVVEFHGFKDNHNRFVIKELAVVGPKFQSQVIFSAPYGQSVLNEKARKSARWLEQHFHMIKWSEGGIAYDERLVRNLLKPFSIVYTKGLEKSVFLKEFHCNVVEITENLECKDCFVHCILPKHKDDAAKCALRSAVGYYEALHNRT